MKRSMRFGIAVIVGLGIGAVIGATFASRTIGVGARSMSQWAAGAEYAQLAELEYRHADSERARSALNDFLNFAQQMQIHRKVADPKALDIDLARTYWRLALLDRQGGNEQGYQSNISHAQEALQRAGVETGSLAAMGHFLNREDEAKPR